MRKIPVLVSLLFLLFVSSAFAGSITQKSIIVTIPPDYQSKDAYRAEFVIPEGNQAFKFTVWGDDKPWGIIDISEGKNQELYSSSGMGTSSGTVGDTESGEHPASTGTEGDDPLSRLSLNPGTYVIWITGKPGSSITLQYLVQLLR